MSTHNIGFYEDLTKVIFELSLNIIKYAPYFFCCTFLFLQMVLKKKIFSSFGKAYIIVCGCKINHLYR